MTDDDVDQLLAAIEPELEGLRSIARHQAETRWDRGDLEAGEKPWALAIKIGDLLRHIEQRRMESEAAQP